jgi:anti-sigma factor RsiW
MITSMNATPHLDDAALVRLLDGEHSPDERARWDAHLVACARCTGEVDRLRADEAIVRVWLERAAFEVALPRGSTRITVPRAAATPWLRVAAVIALLALPVTAIAAIPTLRAWVVAAIAEWRDDDDTGVTATQAANADAVDHVGRAYFVPAAGRFTVELAAAQTAGTLRIAHGTGESVVFDQDGTDAVFSESMLRIRNTPEAARSYVLQVPLTVTSVRVRIAARTIAVLDANALRAGAELPLGAR